MSEKKNTYNIDDHNNVLLAKWLSGELDSESLKAFELSEDFKFYQKIADTTARLKVPDPNIKAKLLEQKKYNNTFKKEKNTNIISLKSLVFVVAASLVLFFSLLFFQDSSTSIETQFAETKSYILPDSSIVTLNANSKITFNKDKFLTKRILKLDGEAYFKVQKGSAFIVLSPSGSVKVLGTAFNVFDRNSSFKVYCNEGKVRVKSKSGKQFIITKNKGVFSNKEIPLSLSPINTFVPQWRSGKSVYYETALYDVFEEIKRQFGLNIIEGNIDMNRKFTGLFYYTNIKDALNQVCKPMNIEFKITDNEVILYNK